MASWEKSWDASGITYSVELWKEALRVCKPGSHLICLVGQEHIIEWLMPLKTPEPEGQWPSNIILSHSPDCVCVDKQDDKEIWACVSDCPIRIMDGHNDSGGASRFFYCVKAKRSERESNLKGFVDCVKCDKFDSKTHTIDVNGKRLRKIAFATIIQLLNLFL